MWILVMVTVLSTEPLNIAYEPIVRTATLKQCQSVVSSIYKHRIAFYDSSTLVCVPENE